MCEKARHTHFSCSNLSKWWWLWWAWSSGRCQSICLLIISHFFHIGKSQMNFFKVDAYRYYLGVNNIWRKDINMVQWQGGCFIAHCVLMERMRTAEKHNLHINTCSGQMWFRRYAIGMIHLDLKVLMKAKLRLYFSCTVHELRPV